MLKESLLIVDDQADNIRILSAILTEKGYKVRKAINGKMAIDTIKFKPPDLILLDINMPEINGYEVCKILKVDLETQNIPIIFVSALDDVIDKVKAFQLGGLDYITKPFQKEEVIARVENQLTIRSQQKQLEAEIKQRQKTEERLKFYLHAVSHDLRNPVIGLSMIFKNILQQDQSLTISILRSVVERMENSCDRQIQLINSLVETQQHEIWGITLQCQALNLYLLAQEISIVWLPRLQEKQATLINNIPPDLPLVQADLSQIWRVYENLLANALKYNLSNLEITFNAEIIQNNLIDTPQMICCIVSDNGVGMTVEQAKTLFTPYNRGEGTQGNLSLGLGLYLCHQIIKAHGGTIEVITQPQQGTQFWFTLPVAN
ncbi:hybrid sensor histidine kinase/response regulator [Chroococcus sp. FPU101]|uniref:hybrid sensor histidine kinase/response regulator n=1 Tax=Chroococcus sp. FPU101 TaxID=1974212 RepID=UPI001A8DDAD3|nr:hybrid sensor histidine kinase/response regulator [Chroococcus sp. FPU101]GFE70186.1 response regulator receiver sensor signal transduction histidine kinase [Chroococcus sp. FPU101]